MWIAVLLAALALGVFCVALFNGLIRLRNTGNNAWSDVDVHLKKRHDLVPNLVETVKGYARHEKETLERVVLARNQAVSATSTAAKSNAEDAFDPEPPGTLRPRGGLPRPQPRWDDFRNRDHSPPFSSSSAPFVSC